MLPDPTDGMVSVRPALRGPVNRARPVRTNAPLLAVLTHSAHQGSKAPGGVFVAGPAHGTSAVSEDGARAADGFADERLGVEPVGCDVDGPPDDALRVLSHRGEADLLGSPNQRTTLPLVVTSLSCPMWERRG